MDFFISNAYAQTAGAPTGGGSPLSMILFMGLFFVVFYFLLIRPQNKRAKELRAMLAALAVGNEVVTSGGIVGKVASLDENFVSIEIAANVVIKVQRSQIAGLVPNGTLKGS